MSDLKTPMLLQPDSLFTSVDTCGTNQPEEVQQLHRMIMNAGYQQAIGRELEVSGDCVQERSGQLLSAAAQPVAQRTGWPHRQLVYHSIKK